MKKLVFKRGVKAIIFPVHRPMGDFLFIKTGEKEIAKIRSLYQNRKDVYWNYRVSLTSEFAEVIAYKK